MTKRLRPFFCFYGGKHRTAARYPAPEHGHVVEPFAGSAGYATLHHARRVTLVEKDERLAALWFYLTRVTPAEVRSIPLIHMDQSVDDVRGPDEARTLVGLWLNAASAGPCRTPSAWMRRGHNPRCFWGEHVRDRVASQVEHIRHWRVIHGDFSSAPDVEATWFVDPPYQRAGKHYRCKMSDGDFTRLAEWSRHRRGLVIACENVGADWLPFEPFLLAKANQSNNGGKKSHEAIYVQREPLSEAA